MFVWLKCLSGCVVVLVDILVCVLLMVSRLFVYVGIWTVKFARVVCVDKWSVLVVWCVMWFVLVLCDIWLIFVVFMILLWFIVIWMFFELNKSRKICESLASSLLFVVDVVLCVVFIWIWLFCWVGCVLDFGGGVLLLFGFYVLCFILLFSDVVFVSFSFSTSSRKIWFLILENSFMVLIVVLLCVFLFLVVILLKVNRLVMLCVLKKCCCLGFLSILFVKNFL